MNIPGEKECLRLYEACATPERVRRHCRAVMRRACVLLDELAPRYAMNEELVVAGALLHDLCRTEPNHPAAAAALLEELGMPETARVVACHMRLDADMRAHVDERAVVFLADKLVLEERPCTIAARYLAAVLKGAPPAQMEAEAARVQAFYDSLMA